MKKGLILTLALVLAIGLGIGITLAYLYTDTPSLKNTFEYGDVNIKLEETTGTTYKMIPGNNIAKDPTVTVLKDSEACWLFVKVDESANFGDFMTYGIADGWTPLTDANADGIADNGVYYREVSATTADTSFPVLNGNTVTVNADVLKSDLNAFDTDKNGTLSNTEKEALPTLTFTAYAVQKANVSTVTEAWALVGTKGKPIEG